ncbi:MAG: TolC family protein [Planctomycetes bacterium]|nr:TolC family protein [Planctomycetota bacterium]
MSTNQEQFPEELPPVETTEIILAPGSESGTPLQLQDVIDSVYTSYPLLEAAFLSRSIAEGELLSTRGEFDLQLQGGGTSGPLGFYETNRFGAGARQALFSGGEIFGGYKIGRGNFQPWFGERETNDGGEFSAGISIPLGQNREIDARRAALFRATYGRDAVDPDIQTQSIAFVWEASSAYWQWVAAGRNHQIVRSLLKIAQQRNQRLSHRVDAGDLPRIELTDNQRLIVSREAALIGAQRKLQQSAIKLSLFLRTPDGRPRVPVEAQLPEDFPEAASVDAEQLESDIVIAMLNRPELASLGFLQKQLDVDLAQARNLYLPAVDAGLFASQDVGGAASSSRDKSPFELEASLQVSVPLQRRKARGKMQAIEGKLQQLSAKIEFTQDKITADVQQVFAARLAAYDRIAKARENLKLAHTMEQAERRKFDLGDSNLLLVNLRELATADAEKLVLQAMLDYFQAQTDYRAALALDGNLGIAR